jgi:hypothetical protein
MTTTVAGTREKSTQASHARATAELYAAWDPLGVERRRTSTTGDPGNAFPSALDRLQSADCDRTDAAIAEDPERSTRIP